MVTCCYSFLMRQLRVKRLLSKIKTIHTQPGHAQLSLRALWVNCLWTAGPKNSSQRWGATPQAWKEVSVFAPLPVWELCLSGGVTAFFLHLGVLRLLANVSASRTAVLCTVDFATSLSHSQLLNDSFQRGSECSRDFTASSQWLTFDTLWPKNKREE